MDWPVVEKQTVLNFNEALFLGALCNVFDTLTAACNKIFISAFTRLGETSLGQRSQKCELLLRLQNNFWALAIFLCSDYAVTEPCMSWP